MTTRIAIIGVGRWGVHFVRNFLEHPQAEVTAIVDPSLEQLANFREHSSLDENQILVTTDWDSVRQSGIADAVVIATPATTHYLLIKQALEAGYHVLAEKPLTLTAKTCQELIDLAQKHRRELFTDHTYLFHPAVQRGKESLAAASLGKLYYGYASRTHLGPVRQDVDALWDLAIHDISIFNYWLGQMPIEVAAQGSIWLQSGRENQMPLADLVWVKLTYPDGFEARIHLCWNNPDKQRRLCLVGTKGSLIFDEMSTEQLIFQHGSLEQQGDKFLPTGQWREVLNLEKTEPLKEVCNSFLASVNSQKPCFPASGTMAVQLVQILEALSLSLQYQGKPIVI